MLKGVVIAPAWDWVLKIMTRKALGTGKLTGLLRAAMLTGRERLRLTAASSLLQSKDQTPGVLILTTA